MKIRETEHSIIIVKENEFKNKKLIDIRTYFKNDVGEEIPTKKGVSINYEEAKKLKEYLNNFNFEEKNED